MSVPSVWRTQTPAHGLWAGRSHVVGVPALERLAGLPAHRPVDDVRRLGGLIGAGVFFRRPFRFFPFPCHDLTSMAVVCTGHGAGMYAAPLSRNLRQARAFQDALSSMSSVLEQCGHLYGVSLDRTSSVVAFMFLPHSGHTKETIPQQSRNSSSTFFNGDTSFPLLALYHTAACRDTVRSRLKTNRSRFFAGFLLTHKRIWTTMILHITAHSYIFC